MKPVSVPDPATTEEVIEAIAADYRDHAQMFAPHSPCFEEWAQAAAQDTDLLRLLARLPRAKRQPNLIFAAARWHGVPAPGPYSELRRAFLGPASSDLLNTVRARHTQTNEVGRLACLVPAMNMAADEPLALIDMGASAGLNLFPDRYDYTWPGAGELVGSAGPNLSCKASGPVPVPTRHPRIATRIGVDQNPLSVHNEDHYAWLLNLVWPEQTMRRMRLRSAIDIARGGTLNILRGDLIERLDDAIQLALSSGVRPVVMHSATIAYLDARSRERFRQRMSRLVSSGTCRWIALEGITVLPEITDTAAVAPPTPHVGCLSVDGRAVAWADLHGTHLHWM